MKTAHSWLPLVLSGVIACSTLAAAPASAAPAVMPSVKAITKARLLSAPVPSLCEHRAGRLTKGVWRDGNPGSVTIDLKRTVIGAVKPGQRTGAVATFHCNWGGVAWPDALVFYDQNMKIVGSYSTAKLGHDSGRAQVQAVTLSKGVASIHAIAIGQRDDNSQWGTQSASVKINWSKTKRKLVGTKPTYYNEWPAFRGLIAAVRANNRSAALRYGNAATVDSLLQARRAGAKIYTYSCVGSESANNPSWGPGRLQGGERGCIVGLAYPEHGFGIMVRFAHANAAWTSFKATRMDIFSD